MNKNTALRLYNQARSKKGIIEKINKQIEMAANDGLGYIYYYIHDDSTLTVEQAKEHYSKLGFYTQADNTTLIVSWDDNFQNNNAQTPAQSLPDYVL